LSTYFGLLCNDLDTQTAAMKAAYDAADLPALQKAAHAAKGVAQGLRDQSLSRLAEEIEHRAKDGGDIFGIREKLTEYATLFLRLKCGTTE
jgi:HPt (histidine-containing phosphotransfer) domain-containing protein